jgi:hypothetical protein
MVKPKGIRLLSNFEWDCGESDEHLDQVKIIQDQKLISRTLTKKEITNGLKI